MNNNEEDNEIMNVLEKLGEIRAQNEIFIVETKDGNEIYGNDYISYLDYPEKDKETIDILFDENLVARIYMKTIKDVVEWDSKG
jgi:hypothetical protein